jgi:hypothetical protein
VSLVEALTRLPIQHHHAKSCAFHHLYLKVKLVSVNKLLYRGISSYLCYSVRWVIAPINLPNVLKLALLVGFLQGYNINYKAFLLSSAKLY